jgi:hypothetical protein
MPAPRWLARANRVGLNRVVKYIAPWMPGSGVIVHRGRTSGREFRTPVNLFRRRYELTGPVLYVDESCSDMPAFPVRYILAAMGVSALLYLRIDL